MALIRNSWFEMRFRTLSMLSFSLESYVSTDFCQPDISFFKPAISDFTSLNSWAMSISYVVAFTFANRAFYFFIFSSLPCVHLIVFFFIAFLAGIAIFIVCIYFMFWQFRLL